VNSLPLNARGREEIPAPAPDPEFEIDFSDAVHLSDVDLAVGSIASHLSELAEAFRAVAPAQATKRAANRALQAATVLDGLADESAGLVGAGTSLKAQLNLRRLDDATEHAARALRRGASPDLVRAAMDDFFSQLHDVLARLETLAGRYALPRIAKLDANARRAQIQLRSMLSPTTRRTARKKTNSVSFDLYNVVHALISAALAPPTRLPVLETHSLGGVEIGLAS
jgi:hypothetical protein